MKKYVLFLIGFVWVFQTYARTYYVNINSTSPTPPYTSPATAATNIQAAVDVAVDNDVVYVTDGVYKPSSQIVVSNAIMILSKNGAKSTIVDGGGTHRCFYFGKAKCSLFGFTIQNGKSSGYGGGVYCVNTNPIVAYCRLIKNYSGDCGGGMYYGRVKNSLFVENFAKNEGGGKNLGTVKNSSFVKNFAGRFGGGVSGCNPINNSLFIRNSSNIGGGIAGGSVNNCVVWYNTVTNSLNIKNKNFFMIEEKNVCAPASDYITHGINGCITNEPSLASFDHLSGTSPCIGAGNNLYSSGNDIDGELWKNPPSIGSDEYNQSTKKDLILFLKPIGMASINVPLKIDYYVLGTCSQFFIDFGDGIAVTNQIKQVVHKWISPGTYDVMLTAYNSTYPTGVTITQQVVVVDTPEQYVSPSGNDANDGQSWATAKKTIQAGVNAVTQYGGMVIVTNGIYKPLLEISITRSVLLKSVNGANVTIIDGSETHRCLNLHSTLCCVDGFTIQNGKKSSSGGGVCCENNDPIVENCIFIHNSSDNLGGAIFKGFVNNCSFIENSAESGGGLCKGTANHCSFTKNSAIYGGGLCEGIANNCSFIENSARFGAGMYEGKVNNSFFMRNSAKENGGGIYHGEVNNCSIIKNSAKCGGGVYVGSANNSIVWYNKASVLGNNLYNTSAHYTCSPDGVTNNVNGCISTDPLFVSLSNIHLQNNSPCIQKGSANYVFGYDMDGDIWQNPPSMGCDEVYPTQYVSPVGNDLNNGRSWATAKKTIQAAVDSISYHGNVWVTNGIYYLSSEVSVNKPILIKSVSGPNFTVVDGGGIHRCFNLSNAFCRIEGFTVRNGFAYFGGGIYCENTNPIVAQCNFVNNKAKESGGGMYFGTAKSCSFMQNSSEHLGGGLYSGIANNCSFSQNSAEDDGGGMYTGVANNCILWNNTATHVGGNLYSTITHYTCAPDGIIHGVNGCITNNPLFVSSTDLHLQRNSPCIAMGSINYAPKLDVDGDKWKDPPAMGCDELYILQYVSPIGSDLNDGRSWITAKKTINAAVNDVDDNGIVFVTNGTYQLLSQINVNKKITIKSVCGANATIIDGGGSNRCFNLYGMNCRIEGFTIKNGYTLGNGAGVYCTNKNPTIANCIFIRNSAENDGGGMCYGTANNCTFIQNSAKHGGGIYKGKVNNCIVWYNTAIYSGNNLYLTVANYTCTSEGITNNVNGCITNLPLFMSLSDFHLQPISPCICAGDMNFSLGIDMDGEVWKNPPSMGCDNVSLPVQYVSPDGNDANNGLTWLTAKKTIQSAVNVVNPHGTVFVTNGTYHLSSQIWVNKPILIESINGMNSTVIDGGRSNRCFNLSDVNCRIKGFTIAHGNTTSSGGGVLCVNKMPVIENCIFIENSAENNGGGMYKGTANHCSFSENSSTLHSGGGMYDGVANYCFFTENTAKNNGGGMCQGIANNCSFVANSSENYGGGLSDSIANNSLFRQNSAIFGGGLYYGIAKNCSIIRNFAKDGGGMYKGTARNSIVWYNRATNVGTNLYFVSSYYTSAPDGITHGVNNCITNLPSFINKYGDYHLKTDSPCVDVGNNAYVVGTTDLDGNVRIINNTVDMGCYERASIDIDHDGIADNWEITYFGSIVNCLPTDDSDNDHQNNLAEYIAGTNPTNAASYFHITSITTKTNQSSITWEPVIQARTYSVFWSGNLTTNFTATSSSLYYPQNTYTDTVHHVEDKGFYRVKVEK